MFVMNELLTAMKFLLDNQHWKKKKKLCSNQWKMFFSKTNNEVCHVMAKLLS